jgi:hypothetical protein
MVGQLVNSAFVGIKRLHVTELTHRVLLCGIYPTSIFIKDYRGGFVQFFFQV